MIDKSRNLPVILKSENSIVLRSLLLKTEMQFDRPSIKVPLSLSHMLHSKLDTAVEPLISFFRK